MHLQTLILELQRFWTENGCLLTQPVDIEVGAGTFHPATTLRSLGPEPWRAAYVQPSRRPTDGRYGDNPNRLQHYYQFGGIECDPVSVELTYGLERLAMYVQGRENVYDLDFNGAGTAYGDVFKRSEIEYSHYNFEIADTDMLLRHFKDAEAECKSILERGHALPAYDQCIKASHLFNLLDARGVISVVERASYIGRVRALARACCEQWLAGTANPNAREA